MSGKPLTIAAVIPAYNAAAFIEDTLAAVAGQRRRPDEIIVVDDGSRDDTVARVRQWAASSGVAVRIIEQANQGASAARNAGIRAAASELIATIDADDLVLANHLEVLEGAFIQRPDVDLVFGDAEAFHGPQITRASYLAGSPVVQLPHELLEGDLRVIEGSAYAGIVVGNRIPTSATLYRRQRAIESGLYNPDFPRCNDREFLLRMSRRAKFGYFPIVVERIRKHDANLTHPRHHALHLEQQIRVLKSMLVRRSALELTAEEIDLTRQALRRAVDRLCAARARSGLGPFVRHLLRGAPRDERPSWAAAGGNLLRSVYASLRGAASGRLTP
ncbi:MAG: glycosyltransferase family 2 protein [Pirellulales bacterium]|nr:glycosyltransferase family 2 protein [Pirellulales bacterium]